MTTPLKGRVFEVEMKVADSALTAPYPVGLIATNNYNQSLQADRVLNLTWPPTGDAAVKAVTRTQLRWDDNVYYTPLKGKRIANGRDRPTAYGKWGDYWTCWVDGDKLKVEQWVFQEGTRTPIIAGGAPVFTHEYPVETGDVAVALAVNGQELRVFRRRWPNTTELVATITEKGDGVAAQSLTALTETDTTLQDNVWDVDYVPGLRVEATYNSSTYNYKAALYINGEKVYDPPLDDSEDTFVLAIDTTRKGDERILVARKPVDRRYFDLLDKKGEVLATYAMPTAYNSNSVPFFSLALICAGSPFGAETCKVRYMGTRTVQWYFNYVHEGSVLQAPQRTQEAEFLVYGLSDRFASQESWYFDFPGDGLRYTLKEYDSTVEEEDGGHLMTASYLKL